MTEDREVGTSHASPEDAGAEQPRQRRGERHDQQERDESGAHRFPPGGYHPRAVELHEVGHAAWTGVGELEVHGHQIAAKAEEDALAHGEHAASAPGETDADGDHGQAKELG